MKRQRTAGNRRPSLAHEAPHLRPMQAADVPQVVHLEARAYPSPWTEESFRDCLAGGFCCWVLEHNSVIVAYAIMSLEAPEAHVLNLCVGAAWRRRGLGRILLTHLLRQARDHQVHTVLLHVRASNLPAIRLYESMGFQHVGREAGYYHLPQGYEDALMMARSM